MSKLLSDYLYYHEPGPPDLKIYHGNCLEIMPLLDKVDLVVIDPPYELSDSGPGKSHCRMSLNKFDSESYKEIVTGFNHQKTFGMIESICKPMHLFCFCSNKQISKFMLYGELKDYPTTLLIWNKTNSAPFANGVWRGDAEYCVHIRKRGAYFEGNAELKRKVIQHPIVSDQAHPTEKPILIIKKYIEIGSSENMTILDPFLGSGTTLVACKELKRNGIGIEINEKYCEIAKKRLQNTQVPFI
jgi:DNA modification methylase